MDRFDLYFDDLKEEAQETLLELVGIKDPLEMNWDVIPVATMELEKFKGE